MGILPVSAAEGFFLLSGFMIGYVYAPKMLTNQRSTTKRLWKRAGQLYLLSVFFTLLYTLWAIHQPAQQEVLSLYPRDTVSFLYNTFLLRYSYGWTDFLARYAVFMAVSPFVLYLFSKGKAWFVALLSILTWAVFRHVDATLPFSAWQLLFFVGAIAGYYYPTVARWFKNLSSQTRTIIRKAVATFTVASFALSLVCFSIIPDLVDVYPQLTHSLISNLAESIRNTIQPIDDKVSLDPLRVILSMVWFIGLFLLIKPRERAIEKATNGFFSVFGKNSLYAYGWHGLILFVIGAYFRPTGGSTNIYLSTLVVFVVLTIIYFLTRYRHILTNKRKQLAGVLSLNEVS